MATKAKSSESKRFLGWQKTPIQQARFGRTTRGGKKHSVSSIKHSTGEISTVSPQWFQIDASEAPLGRVATVIATLLMGKHKASFTRGAASGDFVLVTNAEKAYVTANKADKEIVYWHSGYMGGLKSETLRRALERRPEEVIWTAVQGMMPKNRISRYQLTHLKVVRGDKHSLSAQKPTPISLKTSGSLKKLGVVHG